MGFVEQFELRENLWCDPHPSPPQKLATPSPEGKASTRKRELSLVAETMFCFGYQRKEEVPHPLAFPWGKVPTSSAAGGVMSSEQARGHTPHFRSVPSARQTQIWSVLQSPIRTSYIGYYPPFPCWGGAVFYSRAHGSTLNAQRSTLNG